MTRRAREELGRQQRKRTLEELLQRLREEIPIHVQKSRLNFDYQPEAA